MIQKLVLLLDKLMVLGKIRFEFKRRSKSGSIRVIYINFEVYKKIYLITAYPKNKKDNLSKVEKMNLEN
ncbi:MAG: hypothetical protein UHK60_12285 [Acutalibacteraceae bacterium]|nr:hypothetical protein [Acutalibacteraceae bacterium]